MEPFIGQIQAFGFNFPPRGWAKCDGQLLPISQNTALFSLLGTQYGGEGITTFGLPDLRGRAPIHQGSGPGLSNRGLGDKIGNETTTLTTVNLPAHDHSINSAAEGNTDNPSGNYIAGAGLNSYSTVTNTTSKSTAITGEGQATNNMQPSLALNYCIALVGIYPSRN